MPETSIRLESDTRDRLRAAKEGGEKYDETLNRLLDQADALDGGEYDTIVDCLHFLQDAMSDEELPFDPTNMDDDAREEWLDDIAAAEEAINPYATANTD
jgi:hypothetical protein